MSASDTLGQGDLLVMGFDETSGFALVLGESEKLGELGDSIEPVPAQYMEAIAERVGMAGIFAGAIEHRDGRWVRLTRESAAAMKKLGTTTDESGAVMGVLRGEGGRFAHVARFEVPATMGVDPATFAAALAVQQVVKQIEAKLEAIAEDVQGLVQGSKHELEAALASAGDIIVRIERRVRDRGIVDDDDWASLANLEPIVKQAYHQTHLWLNPLREYLADGELTLVEQVKALRGDHGLRDADFWLRMHLHSELALKRWELLYVLRESIVAPERLAAEAQVIRERAEQRHQQLIEVTELLAAYLERGERDGWTDRIRILNRHRLRQLHRELALVANAYAGALRASELSVPVFVEVPESVPLIDMEEVSRFLREQALPSAGAGLRSAKDRVSSAGRSSMGRLRALGSRGSDDEEE